MPIHQDRMIAVIAESLSAHKCLQIAKDACAQARQSQLAPAEALHGLAALIESLTPENHSAMVGTNATAIEYYHFKRNKRLNEARQKRAAGARALAGVPKRPTAPVYSNVEGFNPDPNHKSELEKMVEEIQAKERATLAKPAPITIPNLQALADELDLQDQGIGDAIKDL